jgi:hypothetical protein
MRLFVSYSREDQQAVAMLVEILRAGQHEVLFDHQLTIGRNWQEELLEFIQQCEVFVYALTPSSVTSEWCLWEFAEAVRQNKPIVPVLLDAKTKLPKALSNVQYADFSNGWDPIATARLIAGLAKTAVTIMPAKVSAPEKPAGIPAQIESLPEASQETLDSVTLPSLEVARMVDWFFEHYEDPANGVPYDSNGGRYQYVFGGPYHAREELSKHFPDAKGEEIENATQIIEVEGWEWVKRGDY